MWILFSCHACVAAVEVINHFQITYSVRAQSTRLVRAPSSLQSDLVLAHCIWVVKLMTQYLVNHELHKPGFVSV